jgi:hypothetical protein
MSMKAKIEAAHRRAVEDQSLAKTDAPAVVSIPKPEDDVDLQAALAKVAAGGLISASRTRNGVLVETKGSVSEESQLHILQQGGDR